MRLSILMAALALGCAAESSEQPAAEAEFVYSHTINLRTDECANLRSTSLDVRLRGERCEADGARCDDTGQFPVDVLVRRGFDAGSAPFGVASYVEIEACQR